MKRLIATTAMAFAMAMPAKADTVDEWMPQIKQLIKCAATWRYAVTTAHMTKEPKLGEKAKGYERGAQFTARWLLQFAKMSHSDFANMSKAEQSKSMKRAVTFVKTRIEGDYRRMNIYNAPDSVLSGDNIDECLSLLPLQQKIIDQAFSLAAKK